MVRKKERRIYKSKAQKDGPTPEIYYLNFFCCISLFLDAFYDYSVIFCSDSLILIEGWIT